VDERQQPPDQLLPRRVVAGLGTERKLVRFFTGDRLRGPGCIPQLLGDGIAVVPFGASGQIPLHRHAPIVPHGSGTTDVARDDFALR
jgi:hypothetical protein